MTAALLVAGAARSHAQAAREQEAKLIAVHVVAPVQPPEEMRQFLIDDISRNKEVIEKNNIKVD